MRFYILYASNASYCLLTFSENLISKLNHIKHKLFKIKKLRKTQHFLLAYYFSIYQRHLKIFSKNDQPRNFICKKKIEIININIINNIIKTLKSAEKPRI